MTLTYVDYGFTVTDEQPEHLVRMEPTPQRIRVLFGGETIADSKRVLIMHETKHTPVYYFPFSDVRMDLTEPTENATF